MKQLTVLIILDGYGLKSESKNNPILKANPTFIEKISNQFLSSKLEASGPAVGLPPKKDGNSEVGHLNLGAGRIVYQELPKIDLELADEKFFQNPAFKSACDHARKNKSNLHLLGLVGTGTVHSNQKHLDGLLQLAAKEKIPQDKVKLHLITDGRDSAVDYAPHALKEVEDWIDKAGVGQIATIAGRFYAMDRNKYWDRTKLSYEAVVQGKGPKSKRPLEAIKMAYADKITDEFIVPTVLTDESNNPLGVIEDHDALIFFNYRADRSRQLTEALINPDFLDFKREKIVKDLFMVTMTSYDKDFKVSGVAYPSEIINQGLSEVLSRENIPQLHLAETEKYAHVTYFFNGRREEPFEFEERILIASPKVETYDLAPRMSADEITATAIAQINEDRFEFILINYANADMVAHTGSYDKTVEAITCLDGCLNQLYTTISAHNGTLIITADHGNAEDVNESGFLKGSVTTAHSTNPVPLIIVNPNYTKQSHILNDGILADVAPTILFILDLAQPMEMTGRVLLAKK
ncbi:phosphoglycerate mutase (2,3-diphosphoglycerate-independent) [candidate division WWE3 bacterium RIFCSPLOWO2_01_FULL_42_11]|uniref:2,3-bisphosphoglycerate-independent phosphoglycerate mutase n=1 Tax=candidate division WWE3 bacterium RIFCSPLOWO2_01_FULL_42_11 TaxID=1802627 RepID=A0A1F4VQR5_UNCKA|nr:MAG: phosphoglycerate mutase (2,3-diphosphoglycerate-independent) [candidate division WWE3 bacterium RIFCSPLOWO2_01_FULL_42_11]